MSGIGLTNEQASAVKSTWSMVEKDLKQHGINAFIRLFTKYPATQQLFKNFKDTPLCDLEKKPGLRAHGLGFMKEFSGMIENLEEPETLVAAIEANAVRHYGRGVTVDFYEKTMLLIHGYLGEQLGDAFTKDASDGWKLVADVLVATVAKKYKALDAEKSYWTWCTVM